MKNIQECFYRAHPDEKYPRGVGICSAAKDRIGFGAGGEEKMHNH